MTTSRLMNVDRLLEQLSPHHFQDRYRSTCPDCDSINIEEMKLESDYETGGELRYYRCHDCGSEFDSLA